MGSKEGGHGGGAYLSHDIYLPVVHQLQQGGGCIGVAAGEEESKEHSAQKEELHVFLFLSFLLFLCVELFVSDKKGGLNSYD